jgi:hypothetical protein
VRLEPEGLKRSGRMLADAAMLVERAAHTVAPSSSTLGRIAAAASVARIGARLIPAGARLLRRYPMGSLLVAAGFLGVLHLARTSRTPLQPRPRLS